VTSIRTAPRWLCALQVFLLALSLARIVSAGQPGAQLSDAGPIIQEFSKQIQDQRRPEAERLDLIKTFGAWGTAEVRDSLLVTLKDPLVSIRAASARALGWSGNREAVAALRERIAMAGEAPAVKAAALESLGRIGNDSGRAVVLAYVHDANDEVRRAALWSVTFGSLAKPADRTVFLRQVAEDRSLDLLIRCDAIQALGEAKDVGSTDLLARLVEHEPPIPMPEPKEGVGQQSSQQELMMSRYRQARDVRAWAATSLGLIEAKAALPLLIQSAEAPDDFFLRLAAVRVLVVWNVPEARAALVRSLGDSFPLTRQIALVGLAKSGDPGVLGAVLGRLSDPHPQVRAQAVLALGELGDASARPELEALRQKDGNAEVQRALEKVLTSLPR
jgi:HEAT repeat protein